MRIAAITDRGDIGRPMEEGLFCSCDRRSRQACVPMRIAAITDRGYRVSAPSR